MWLIKNILTFFLLLNSNHETSLWNKYSLFNLMWFNFHFELFNTQCILLNISYLCSRLLPLYCCTIATLSFALYLKEIIFISADQGKVLKVLHTSEEVFIISQYSLFHNEGPVLNMAIDSQKVWVMTLKCVVKGDSSYFRVS